MPSATNTPLLIQPPGPVSNRPPLIQAAKAACARRPALDNAACTGAVAAYVWGYPLVEMSATRDRIACVTGINKLISVRKLAGPTSTSVVAPNDDTLYSTAWLDLRSGPELLTVPAISDRYYSFQLLDMYTNTFANIGVLTDHGRGGRYAIAGPGWNGKLPSGTTRIDAPTPDVWLLGRTELIGPSDLAAVEAIQQRYVLRPLTGAGSGTIAGPSTFRCPAPTTSFFDQLAAAKAADPPPSYDVPVLRIMAAAGIRAGALPSATTDPAVQQADAAGLVIGPGLIDAAASSANKAVHGGWTRTRVTGTFGTDYLTRALVAKYGLGEQVSSQAIYFSATQDADGGQLSGSQEYEVRFPKGELPPTGPDGFWSITMYNASDFLVANPIDRYSVGSHMTRLVRGADGSVTVVLSTTSPSSPTVNWLPAPTGLFRISLRVDAPATAVSDGSWVPPSVQPLSSRADQRPTVGPLASSDVDTARSPLSG